MASFAVGTVCYGTTAEAAVALCATTYPKTFESAGVTAVVSCTGAAVSGLPEGTARLTLTRSTGDVTPTASVVQVQMPPCDGVGAGGVGLDATFWLGCVLAMALGFIGGQQR